MQILFRHVGNKELRLIGECPEDAEYIINLCDELATWASMLWLDNEGAVFDKKLGRALGIDMMKVIDALCSEEED